MKYGFWFELGKVFVPALAIAASIYLGTLNIGAQQEKDRKSAAEQRDKDRRVEVSQHLTHFQNQITAMVEGTDKSRTWDVAKQRNAIAVIRNLRGSAVPSLLANLEINHDPQILQAAKVAILELNEDDELRDMIAKELLTSVKYAAIRVDFPALDEYVPLWRDCLDQYRKVDGSFFRQSALKGNELADEAMAEAGSKSLKQLDNDKAHRLIRTINSLRTKL